MDRVQFIEAIKDSIAPDSDERFYRRKVDEYFRRSAKAESKKAICGKSWNTCLISDRAQSLMN